MRRLIIVLLAFSYVSAFFSCDKKNSCNITATITQKGTTCSSWGIQVGNTYPSYNIPNEFRHEGLQVCVEYELYEDYTMCACCGGTRARIIKMSLPPD
jgi:hypothetical protein